MNRQPRTPGRKSRAILAALAAVALVAVACAPAAAPSPTTAPAKPAPTTAAQPAPTQPPTAKPAETQLAAKPTEKPAAKADTKAVEDFYRGKTIRIIVGSAAGGGYDTYARTIARHIGKYIPGNPNVIVENMPGAGSLKAANHVYNVAEKDGTIIGSIQGGLFVQQLLGLEGVEFDTLKWQMIGFPTGEKPTCVVTSRSGLKSLVDSMGPGGKQFIAGGNAPGSATWDVPMRLKAALDLNLKMVAGYDGTAKVRLAMDQGEVDGMCGWGYESLRATAWDRVQSGEYVVIARVSDSPMPGLEKVPLALDLAKTEESRQLIRLGIIAPAKTVRAYLVAPEVPAERVRALRQAFGATMKDKDFLHDAEKSKLEIDPIPAEEGQKMVHDLFSMPESIKKKLKEINDQKV